MESEELFIGGGKGTNVLKAGELWGKKRGHEEGLERKSNQVHELMVKAEGRDGIFTGLCLFNLCLKQIINPSFYAELQI